MTESITRDLMGAARKIAARLGLAVERAEAAVMLACERQSFMLADNLGVHLDPTRCGSPAAFTAAFLAACDQE